MKRKFLAALLALVMVFSMIPVSASAAGNVIVTGDDPITDNDRSVSFHLYTTQLYKLIMLEDNSATADSDVSGVSLLLYNGFGVLDRTELSLRKIGATKAETDYFEYSDTNRGHALEPNNIEGLKISYSTGDSQKEITIDASKLLLHCKRGALGLTADYTIMSSNTDKSIVAFYDNGGNAQQVAYSLWDAYIVETNSTLGDTNWPKDPDYIGESYTFFGWDEYKGGGKPFSQASVVTGDTQVFSQKTTTTGEHSGLHIHVMNRENTLKNRFVELYNATNNDSITISNVNWGTTQITLVGNNGEKSNPQYNLGATPNQWGKDDEYYWVQNPDADEETFGTPQYNKHIPPDAIVAIEVAAEVNGVMSTVTMYRGVNCGEFSVAFIDDELFEIVIQAAPTPPTGTELEDPDDNAIFPAGAVTIDCTNEQANHTDETYSLIAGTYTVSESATWVSDGEGSGYYTAEVTIDFDKVDQYVTKYATEYADVTHTLMPEQGDQKITLIWQNGQWVADESAPVTYNVACDTEPEDEPPEKPTWEDVERIFKDAIKVDCVNSNATHNDGTYDALEGSYTLGTITPSENLYTVELTFSAEKYLSEYNNLYGNHVLTGEQKNVLTLIYRNDIWCYEGGERYPVIFSVTCEDGGEEPDSNFVTQYWVMNDLDVIEKVFSAKEPDKELAGIELGTSTGIATDGETLGNGWNNSEDKHYYIVSNGEPNGDNYVPWKEVSRLTFLYENGSNGITNLDIRVEEPDENGISKVYLLYDVRYNFNNGTTNGWNHTDSTKNWASASTYTVVTPTSPYLTPPNGDGREVELIGWSQTQHNTIFEPNAELPDHLTAGGTFTVDPNAENTNNTSLMINLYAVWAYKDTSTEPTPEPTPDPDPTPDPTPTPGPGGGDNPPYIPPVDPDDSGVSDLLNTDDHIQYLFGYPEGTFGPENNMTRAEVAQMFYNLLLDQDVTITKTFNDVPANAWYTKAVNTLASLGVVSGVGNGDFEPERSITRAEFTSIAMKFAEGKNGGTNIFSDVKPTDWFYRAVVNSTQYGWIHGYGDGTFRPNNPITRVEVTAIVNNMLGREADVDFVTEHYDELNHFSDLAVSHWGYYHIVEATNDHDYTKPSSGENWTKLN